MWSVLKHEDRNGRVELIWRRFDDYSGMKPSIHHAKMIFTNYFILANKYGQKFLNGFV